MKKILCLHGGGSLTSYTVGFLIAMERKGLLKDINTVVGTSGGALIAGLVGKYLNNWENIGSKVWLNIHKDSDIYDRCLTAPTVVWTGLTNYPSILDPKGLRQILNIQFKDMKFSNFLIPVYVQAGKLDNGTWIDGGAVGQNFPIMLALQLEPTHIVMCGVSPNQEPDAIKTFSGEDNVIKGLLSSSAIPILFPPILDDGIKYQSYVEYAKKLIQVMMDSMEEMSWSYLELYEKLNINLKKLESFPKVGLKHDALNFEHVAEDVEQGIKEGLEYLTEERIKEWNS